MQLTHRGNTGSSQCVRLGVRREGRGRGTGTLSLSYRSIKEVAPNCSGVGGDSQRMFQREDCTTLRTADQQQFAFQRA